MPTYTVHAPPPKSGASSNPERFVFVRDGFHFWAFVAAPLWLLLHRLWLALVIYILGSAILGIGLVLLRAPANAQFLAGLLIALLIGFEAPSIRRWTLARRRWAPLGFVVGENREMAEQRFFAQWTQNAASIQATSSLSSGPKTSGIPRREPPSSPDVIGLFPEPGGQR